MKKYFNSINSQIILLCGLLCDSTPWFRPRLRSCLQRDITYNSFCLHDSSAGLHDLLLLTWKLFLRGQPRTRKQ